MGMCILDSPGPTTVGRRRAENGSMRDPLVI